MVGNKLKISPVPAVERRFEGLPIALSGSEARDEALKGMRGVCGIKNVVISWIQRKVD